MKGRDYAGALAGEGQACLVALRFEGARLGWIIVSKAHRGMAIFIYRVLLTHPSTHIKTNVQKSHKQGDPEIDTSRVDSTTKVKDYDGETQGALRKIMVRFRVFVVGFGSA